MAHSLATFGRHLECGIQTELVVELELALNEKRPTNEFWSDSGFFLSSYRVNITSCKLCARANIKGHSELKIEQTPALVKLVEGF